ncbi:cytochrome b/b6 domain-containing protein [Bdellovibrionota bacterium FG-1]
MKNVKMIRLEDGTILIERFSPVRRFEHIFVVILFVLLAVTGMPQKYFTTTWASWVLKAFGGLDNLRIFHRLSGLVFCFHLVIHLVGFVVGVLRDRMRMTLLPTAQDIYDIVDTLSYYLGYRKNPPLYPKFDYRQKFEYFGIVLGGMVMALSGLALLYPNRVVQFMSGEVILAAREAHSNEAVLALLVLVVWHMYGAHLSPEVFPGDSSILHGYITKEDLAKRHGAEYQRLFEELPPAEEEKRESK